MQSHLSRREALRLAAATALGSAVSSAQSVRVFDARDFGAVGDGTTVCTAAIGAAVRVCSQRGGGQVVVPAGRFLRNASARRCIEPAMAGVTVRAVLHSTSETAPPRPGTRKSTSSPCSSRK